VVGHRAFSNGPLAPAMADAPSCGARSQTAILPVPDSGVSSDANIEYRRVGVFHPVLLLPEGLAALTQFDTIMAHELHHVPHRYNLTAALHMCVETVFWFHPMVWWIGAKLMDERERDCDEAVLAQGGSPGEYARGILQICRRYGGSPLPCAAGIGGSDLKKRIREIMAWRASLPVTSRGRAALVAAAARRRRARVSSRHSIVAVSGWP